MTRLHLAIGVVAAFAVCPLAAAGPDPGSSDTDAQRLLDRTLRNLHEGDFAQVFEFVGRCRTGRASSMRVIERDDQPDVGAAAPAED